MIGDWNMELTNTEGKTYKFRGSLCSEFVVQGVDLSDLLRNSLDMPDLYVFDGNNNPDIVNRIEVFYHRITKIKPKEPISEHTEYAVWDYTEYREESGEGRNGTVKPDLKKYILPNLPYLFLLLLNSQP